MKIKKILCVFILTFILLTPFVFLTDNVSLAQGKDVLVNDATSLLYMSLNNTLKRSSFTLTYDEETEGGYYVSNSQNVIKFQSNNGNPIIYTNEISNFKLNSSNNTSTSTTESYIYREGSLVKYLKHF